jgi:hypothetical protein
LSSALSSLFPLPVDYEICAPPRFSAPPQPRSKGAKPETSGTKTNPSSFKLFLSSVCHGDEKLTNTGNWYQRSEITAVTKPDHVVLKSLELVCRKSLKKFGVLD